MLSRREFLKLISTSFLLFNPFKVLFAFDSVIKPFELVDLIDFSCLKCNFRGICIKWEDGHPKIGVRISYWVPAGFAETGSAFEFGASHPTLGFLSELYKPLIESLEPHIPKGGKTTTFVRGGEVYFKLYPHYLGWGNFILSSLARAVTAAIAGQPWCLCGVLENAIKIRISEVSRRVKSIYEHLDLSEYLEPLQKLEAFSSLLNSLPFFAAEFVFPIWIIDTLSPDNKTFAPFFNALIKTLTEQNLPLGALVCPHLMEHLFTRKIKFPSGVDPSFLCVGHWGFGYPRTGLVNHPDPLVAGLLSIARFLHLFSRTFPVVDLAYSNQTVKFQMFNPHKTGCFKPGYYTSDPTAKPFFETLSDKGYRLPKDLRLPDTLQSPPLKPNYRNVGVVIWKYYSHCCF